ncbi:MAG: GNAT family N-acetyltransferase [Planctomycetes bacterium]|nr:GNAT family N-acetyltransferase [Planctomycetota bacterium]MBM4078384.1 GNAT family N-acetyltransferase [Planctomycetota bacterium]MBM4084173.1 GNAT family N-acetyltransferase [Planctomycetota bacterium]
MEPGYEMAVLPPEDWKAHIAEVISVRTSAYEKWNGPKSKEEQAREAEQWLRKWSARRAPVLIVAKKDREVVGYVSGDERDLGEFYISHIGVREDLKRRGIGRSLVRRLEEHAKLQGCRAVRTTTYNRFKGMLILLLHQGFYIQGTTWVEGATEPSISLRKEL